MLGLKYHVFASVVLTPVPGEDFSFRFQALINGVPGYGVRILNVAFCTPRFEKI